MNEMDFQSLLTDRLKEIARATPAGIVLQKAAPASAPVKMLTTGKDASYTPETGLTTAMHVAAVPAVGALFYHGYKRTGTVGNSLLWGLLGGLVWPITLPIALAQGFGKHK